MANRTGFIISIGEIEKKWRIDHGVKDKGHTNMSGFGFLRRIQRLPAMDWSAKNQAET